MGAPGHRQLQAAVIVAIFAASSTPLLAQKAGCSSITDEKERLACYDKAAAVPAAPKKPPAPKSDPSIEVAKQRITAKLKDPGSAQFSKITRAMKPDVQGNPKDTVCGFVNARNSYGGYTGERPFVFFPQDGDGYLVDSNPQPGDVAPLIYRRFCL